MRRRILSLLFIFSVLAGEELSLSGSLPSYIESNDYIVVGDITIDAGNSSHIVAGTRFLFDGPYSFIINGSVTVDGALGDSVYFINNDANVSDENKWEGIYMENVTSASSFDHVQVTGTQTYGMYLKLSNPSLSNMLINYNSGNGLHLYNSSPIIDNLSSLNNGGRGIYMQESSEPVVSNSKFNYNSYGGYQTTSSYAIFNNCEFSYNDNSTSEYNYGGVAYKTAGLSGGFQFNNCKFQHNVTLSRGPLWHEVYYGAGHYNNCIISNNTQVGVQDYSIGATVILNYNSFIFFRNTVIADNKAIVRDDVTGSYDDYNFAAGLGLVSQDYSGGSNMVYPKLTFINSIIYNNLVEYQGQLYPSQIGMSNSYAGTGHPRGKCVLVFSHNNIQGGMEEFEYGAMVPYYNPDQFIYWLDGNIDVNPLFNEDYTLQDGSELIDQGTTSLSMQPWQDPWDDDWDLAYDLYDTYGSACGNCGIEEYWRLPDDWERYEIHHLDPADYFADGPDIGAYENSNATAAPLMPTGLVATPGNAQVVLTWTANSESDLASYKVYGGNSASPTTLLSTVSTGTETYTHTSLTNGTTYYYRISAVNNAGNESDKTSDVSVLLFQPQTTAELQTAVNLWVSDKTSALGAFGEINTWDVSLITDMSSLFQDKTTFNDDISSWDVSAVTSMLGMFNVLLCSMETSVDGMYQM
jgi:parallel beta-helix repeat protein